MSTASGREVHLAAHFPGVNSATIWSHPRSGSQTEFASFAHFAATAERGLMDFVFLAEGLRVREHAGRIHDLDVVGRPDSLTVLASVAAITSRIGLVATLNTTFNEPYELARQLLSLDAVSGGRAGWNVVTTSDAFTGENFRRGGFLPHEDRYLRAADFIETAEELWQAAASGSRVEHTTRHFTVDAQPDWPRSAQGRPVRLQAGASPKGREIAARYADAIFSPYNTPDEARPFAADIAARLTANGRQRNDLKILPAASFAIGDDEADATERARAEVRAQVSAATALLRIEEIWGIELPGLDADAPLPPLELVRADVALSQGRARKLDDRLSTATAWKARADAEGLSIHQLAVALAPPPRLVGTAESIAQEIDSAVQSGDIDGFILVPSLTPTGLDDFVARVVPVLQERGVYRTAYAGSTLHENLGTLSAAH